LVPHFLTDTAQLPDGHPWRHRRHGRDVLRRWTAPALFLPNPGTNPPKPHPLSFREPLHVPCSNDPMDRLPADPALLGQTEPDLSGRQGVHPGDLRPGREVMAAFLRKREGLM